jgi:hypothetical protein
MDRQTAAFDAGKTGDFVGNSWPRGSSDETSTGSSARISSSQSVNRRGVSAEDYGMAVAARISMIYWLGLRIKVFLSRTKRFFITN